MMWFSRQRFTLKNLEMHRFVDAHSHILPGVDDGIECLEDALSVLNFYETMGVRQLWLTPHIMEDIPNDTAFLKTQYQTLVEAYHGNINLQLGSENMLDTLFNERLAANDLLPMGTSRDHLLVETSIFYRPNNFYQMLEKVQQRGYQPILAHPERYIYMHESDYQQLKKMGIKFQLNLFSLSVQQEKKVQERAFWLFSHRYYEMMGTDLHHLPQLYEMQFSERAVRMIMMMKNKQWD